MSLHPEVIRQVQARIRSLETPFDLGSSRQDINTRFTLDDDRYYFGWECHMDRIQNGEDPFRLIVTKNQHPVSLTRDDTRNLWSMVFEHLPGTHEVNMTSAPGVPGLVAEMVFAVWGQELRLDICIDGINITTADGRFNQIARQVTDGYPELWWLTPNNIDVPFTRSAWVSLERMLRRMNNEAWGWRPMPGHFRSNGGSLTAQNYKVVFILPCVYPTQMGAEPRWRIAGNSSPSPEVGTADGAAEVGRGGRPVPVGMGRPRRVLDV